jgi:hypothetical protein
MYSGNPNFMKILFKKNMVIFIKYMELQFFLDETCFILYNVCVNIEYKACTTGGKWSKPQGVQMF